MQNLHFFFTIVHWLCYDYLVSDNEPSPHVSLPKPEGECWYYIEVFQLA